MSDADTIRNLQNALSNEQAAHQATLNAVARLADRVERMDTRLKTLNQQFKAFTEEDRRARNMQFAQSALIDIRAQRDRQFGHYATVRRGTIGMLQAMDAGVVTESALRQAAERLMIDTPGYWLAPAQVALAAWISNSEELARRALLEAVSREPNKTALFFSLVLARHMRYEAAAQWMLEYVSLQNPTALSREFTVVLDAVAQGALGGRALQVVKDCCFTWYERLRKDQAIVREQSARWLKWMSQNRRKLGQQFTTLPAICPDWPQVVEWLETATAHEQTEGWLRAQLEPEVTRQDGFRQRVDGVLYNLVTAYDEDEDSLRQEEAKWANVVKRGGHEEEDAKPDAAPAEEPRTDFLALLTTIGLAPEEVGASLTTQQFAIRLASEWIENAAHELTTKSRDDNPFPLKVQIGNWMGRLGSSGMNRGVVDEYTEFVDREVRDEIGQMTIRPEIVLVSLSIALFIGSLATLPMGWLGFDAHLAGAALGFVIAVPSFIRLRRSMRLLPVRREEVKARGEDRKREGAYRLRLASRETRDTSALWESELAKEASLTDFMSDQALRVDQLPALPARTVDSVTPAAELPSSRRAEVEASGGPAQHSPGDSQSFAFKLPRWNLLPPPRHIGEPVSRRIDRSGGPAADHRDKP